MEINKNLTTELEKAWRNLCKDVKRDRKIKLENFENTFNNTYLLLKSCSADNALDKQYVRMIAEAYLFASIHEDTLPSELLAATVLTERMLNNFAFQTACSAEVSTVYILEAHEEVELDFNDVTESISRLIRIFDDAYLKKLAK